MKFLSIGKNYFTIFILFILNCAVDKEFVQPNFNQQDLVHPNETKPASIKLSDSSFDKQKKERILTYKGNLTLEISSGQSDFIRDKIYEYKSKLFRLENQAQYSLLNIQLKEKSTHGPIGWVFYVIYRGLRYLFVID